MGRGTSAEEEEEENPMSKTTKEGRPARKT